MFSTTPVASSAKRPSLSADSTNKNALPNNTPTRLSQVEPTDVVFGRGGHTSNNPGNQIYRSFLAQRLEGYQKLKENIGKTAYTKKMVEAFHKAYPSMRFVKIVSNQRDLGKKLCVMVGDEKVREITAQSLRDLKQLPRDRIAHLVRQANNSFHRSEPAAALPQAAQNNRDNKIGYAVRLTPDSNQRAAKRLKSSDMRDQQTNSREKFRSGNAVSNSQSGLDLLANVISIQEKVSNPRDVIITDFINIFKKILVDVAHSDLRNDYISPLGSEAPIVTKEKILAVMNGDEESRNLKLLELVNVHVYVKFYQRHQQFIQEVVWIKGDQKILGERIVGAIEDLKLPKEFIQALAS